MNANEIRFQDGSAYEQLMGVWSQLAGKRFLEWLDPPGGMQWIDIGCGNGCFTQLLTDLLAPSSVTGIDPSPEQLAFARQRNAVADYHPGEAEKLPFETSRFDGATMALVLFFVPNPAAAVAEMVRVVRPGGIAAAYVWDMLGGGFPYDAVAVELENSGLSVPMPPSVEVSRMENLVTLWEQAGLLSVRTDVIEVERTFAGLETFWDIARTGAFGRSISSLSDEEQGRLKTAISRHLKTDRQGRLTTHARANAITGIVPASNS